MIYLDSKISVGGPSPVEWGLRQHVPQNLKQSCSVHINYDVLMIMEVRISVWLTRQFRLLDYTVYRLDFTFSLDSMPHLLPDSLKSILTAIVSHKLFALRCSHSFRSHRQTTFQLRSSFNMEWNPVEICNSPSLASFKKHLKTRYFTCAFPYASDRRSRNMYQKLIPEKLVTVSGTYDIQSFIDFFWYQTLVSDRTCSIRCQKLVPVFLSVCHWD